MPLHVFWMGKKKQNFVMEKCIVASVTGHFAPICVKEVSITAGLNVYICVYLCAFVVTLFTAEVYVHEH